MRRLFIHRVDVSRQPETITNLERDKGLRQVLSSVPCLIEPRPTIETPSQMGRISQADHVMTWSTEDIRVSDTVRWEDPETSEVRHFIVKRRIRDTARPFSSIQPYNVADLLEQVSS